MKTEIESDSQTEATQAENAKVLCQRFARAEATDLNQPKMNLCQTMAFSDAIDAAAVRLGYLSPDMRSWTDEWQKFSRYWRDRSSEAKTIEEKRAVFCELIGVENSPDLWPENPIRAERAKWLEKFRTTRNRDEALSVAMLLINEAFPC